MNKHLQNYSRFCILIISVVVWISGLTVTNASSCCLLIITLIA